MGLTLGNRSASEISAELTTEQEQNHGTRDTAMKTRLKSLLLLSVLALCLIPAYASDGPACKSADVDWLKLLALLGAAIAFAIGLWQYTRAQQWKRAEFLANEIKDLQADTRAATALSMIDWESRDFNLRPGDATPTRVTREMQVRALVPHTIANPSKQLDTQSPTAIDGAQRRGFSEAEADIRDSFDALLDRLDRLGSYLQTRLLTANDMRPYIGYYVNDIAARTTDPDEALWCVSFLTYVHFYHFEGVVWLFREFGYDIGPDASIFRGFVKSVGPARQALAAELQGAARKEQRTRI